MRSRRGEKGSALLLALIVLVLTSTTMLLLATALSIDLRQRREETRRSRMTVLLDAAVAEALASLRDNPDSHGRTARPFGGGEIESTVRTLPDGSLEILATARSVSATRSAIVRVVYGPYGPRVVGWQRTAASG